MKTWGAGGATGRPTAEPVAPAGTTGGRAWKLCGVCHAYADDPIELKRAMNFNFPSHADGVRLHTAILELVHDGKLRPVVGEETEFEGLPAALQRMADRQTTGRSVVHITGA